MKAIIIGSGISGLTSAVLLSKAGYKVALFEQYKKLGGVTGGLERGGFKWDLGQMLLQDLGEGEDCRKVLEKLGISDKIKVIKSYRENYFPDFRISRQNEFKGRLWRINYLKELFPEDGAGLDKFMKIYETILDLATLANKSGFASKLKLLIKGLKIIRKKNWSARKLMDYFFKSKKLQSVFISILADYVISPNDFPGLLIPIINQESQYDERVPLNYGRHEHRSSWSYLSGGCMHLVEVLVDAAKNLGVEIFTNITVTKIKINNNFVKGVIDSNDKEYDADLIIASGGAKELFIDLVGKEYFSTEFLQRYINSLFTTESVFMVHLGVDYDPSVYQNNAALCYYYLSYDIDEGIKNCINGIYHEGEDGFLIYIPSKHSPEMAPKGCHSVTVYTIAPNNPKGIDWERDKDKLAEKLLDFAEKFVPGLREHEKTRVIITPQDFREITHLKKHAFGGTVPHLKISVPTYKTPIENLWFIGAQSQNFGGVSGGIIGADKVVSMILKESKQRIH